jgi:hypothetical protein
LIHRNREQAHSYTVSEVFTDFVFDLGPVGVSLLAIRFQPRRKTKIKRGSG